MCSCLNTDIDPKIPGLFQASGSFIPGPILCTKYCLGVGVSHLAAKIPGFSRTSYHFY